MKCLSLINVPFYIENLNFSFLCVQNGWMLMGISFLVVPTISCYISTTFDYSFNVCIPCGFSHVWEVYPINYKGIWEILSFEDQKLMSLCVTFLIGIWFWKVRICNVLWSDLECHRGFKVILIIMMIHFKSIHFFIFLVRSNSWWSFVFILWNNSSGILTILSTLELNPMFLRIFLFSKSPLLMFLGHKTGLLIGT